jgi:hypothetical protein
LIASIADRAAEQRSCNLEKSQRQIEPGSLTVRKITTEERTRDRRATSEDVVASEGAAGTFRLLTIRL